MKFPVFFLAGTMAAAVSVPEASALPLFARQTGTACSLCHFQHFPKLNGFGRSFKSAGYTMMGGQAKVEGESLSIPNTLNMAVLTTAGYERSNQATASTLGTTPAKTPGDGVFYVPASGGELSLFFGGRLSENAGFLGELSAGDAVGGAHSSAKMPIQHDMSSLLSSVLEGTRAIVVPFATDAQGASYGFELLNTGANAVQQMSSTTGMNGAHSGAISAQQYIGTNGAAKGVALVLSNPMGYINLTKFDRTGIAGGALTSFDSTYLRVAGIFELAGWDVAAGAQMWSGSSAAANPDPLTATASPLVIAETKAAAIDGQMQGYIGEMPVGFYISYATAPAVAAAGASLGNAYNTYRNNLGVVTNGTVAKRSINVSGEVGVIPDKATLGAAVRYGKSGDGNTDNAFMLIGTYKLAQNMLASLSYTSASGNYWYSNAAGTGTTDTIGNKTYTFNLFTAF